MHLSPFAGELLKLAKAAAKRGLKYDGSQDLFVDPANPKAGAYFFHGAPPEIADSIKEKGLLPLAAKKHNMGYSSKNRQGFLGLFGLKERKQLERTSTQKASVHLTPYPHYAQAYGHFKPSGAWSSEAHVYATYLTKKEMRKKLKVKNPEYSQAFGHRISSPALLHEGKVPPGKLTRFTATEDHERRRRSRFDAQAKARGRNPDDADLKMSNRLDLDLVETHKIPVVEG